jgi:putative tricarboxylic transport membrane protein
MAQMRERLSGNRLADLIVLIALAGLVLWYCLDARSASTHVLNLIFILPVTGLTLLLCVVQFFRHFTHPAQESSNESVRSVIPVISLFVGYTLTLPWLGFDVGTCLFIALFLWLHGERRWPWIVGYAVCFASLASLFFAAMLPYPMPMLVFPS